MSGCDEFTRASLLRRAASGTGLPAIEPGMPLPAGTGLTRRRLLLAGAGLSLTLFGGRLLTPAAFEAGLAEAAAAGPERPIVVSVFLAGGVDTLSLMPPVRDARYSHTLRPTLWIDPDGTLPMTGTDELRWHPAAAALRRLHDAGRLTVFPSIGYSGANGSHFTSRHYYEVGETDPDGRSGWLGRYLDLVGEDHNPVQGMTLGPSLSPMLATERVAVAAADAPDAYTFTTPGLYGGPLQDELVRGFTELGSLTAADPILGPARTAHRDAADLRRTLAAELPDASAGYPDSPLGRRLRDTVRMLAAGLPIRCVALDAQTDFDTHAGQAPTFEEHVAGVGAALEAFQADLEARPGLAERVLTMVWSEFGRRPEENGSAGTDHGAGGLALLMGTRVRGGFVGGYPGLRSLDEEGNLLPTSDFRALYCSVVESWLGQDAAAVIPGADGFARYALFR